MEVSPQRVARPPESDRRPALRISGLRKSFGPVEVLHGIDLEVATGERVALMGPSGSGKSTLLNCICGIEPFDAGELVVGNDDLAGLTSAGGERLRCESLGYIFQDFHLLPTLSAAENIELPAQLSGLPRNERKERTRDLLEKVGLAHRAQHRPDALSGGERQRVAIARAVINRPDLLLADEPTGSLDSAIGTQVLDLLEEVSQVFNIALLLVTHDRSCTRICDRTLQMRDGRITESAK
jgi:ABC-type antimicrobial peptide transport system, ATPase component